MEKHTKTNPDGKVIEETINEDGTKSVKIHVNSLNVNETDEESQKAKKVIEESILPQLGLEEVTITVLHKPTNQFVCHRIHTASYSAFVSTCIQGFPGGYKSTDEFAVIVHGDRGTVAVNPINLDEAL